MYKHKYRTLPVLHCDLGLGLFALCLNVQRVHLRTEEHAASRMLEPFGEVGGDVPEYFSSRIHFAKIEDKTVIAKS